MIRLIALTCLAGVWGAFQLRAVADERSAPNDVPASEKMAFYIYPHQVLAKASRSVDAVRQHFRRIKNHVGSSSRFGTVGIALVHPYTAFIAGKGPYDFHVPSHFVTFYGRVVEAAVAESMPLMVCFNGAQWASAEGPYNAYWKQKNGGRYLSRYIDGKVNESIPFAPPIAPKLIRRFLATGPYADGKNALFLTHSSQAEDLRAARLKVLRLAASMWKQIQKSHANARIIYSTDSEVANFSFRKSEGLMTPIGYEELLTQEFCRQNHIADCRTFFSRKRFTYRTALEKKWFSFRADVHRSFVQDSVNAIRVELDDAVVYTHQIPTLEGEYVSALGHDFASPQRTAFVKGSRPGFTIYVHGKQDAHVEQVSVEIGRKVASGHWAAVEFNPGKTWKGSRRELTAYTLEVLCYLHRNRCRLVAPISWESNPLDQGIKASGVDTGIKEFLRLGPIGDRSAG